MSRRDPTEFVKVVIQEDVSDTEEIQCGICNKTFASEKALKNHAFMEHMDECSSSDNSVVVNVKRENTPTVPKIKLKTQRDNIEVKAREKLISSMKSTSLTTLASENVSYIIVKSEDYEPLKEKKKKKEGAPKKSETKRTKSAPQPLTGPFECLEPSPLGTDGTCHQIFFSCCEYSAHASADHSRRRRAVRCQVCERPLGCADAPLVCQHCGTGFQSTEELQDHLVTKHTKLRPYECKVCHKRFTQQGGVVQHMRMHTGVRPFPCTFCDKAFTQKSGLDQHLRTHTKAKPYRCVVCGKCFAQSVHLRQHMRTHTQLTPFKCLICQKRFKQSSHLNYHLRYHDPSQLNEEQREKYTQLMSIIRRTTPQGDSTEVVETEVQTDQTVDITEQIIAEQSIQDDGDTYIIGDAFEYVG